MGLQVEALMEIGSNGAKNGASEAPAPLNRDSSDFHVALELSTLRNKTASGFLWINDCSSTLNCGRPSWQADHQETLTNIMAMTQ